MYQLKDLFIEYSPMVYRLCLRYCGNKMQAEDLTQDVFVRVDEKIRWFRQESSVATWIYRIASNMCLDHLRTQRRRGKLYELFYLPESRKDYNDFGEAVLDKLSVASLIANASSKTKYVLFLYFFEGLNFTEIAEVVQTSRVSVSKRIARFCKKQGMLFIDPERENEEQSVNTLMTKVIECEGEQS
jgi:RNA polymerase sigma-70 factor, ECF subfamily